MKRAAVVADGAVHVETALGALAAVGYEAVAVPGAVEAKTQVESGASVVVLGMRAGGSSPALPVALATMPGALRRTCVVVLVGDEMTTGDAGLAFRLGADLTLSSRDLASVGEVVGRAVAAKKALVATLDPAAAARLAG